MKKANYLIQMICCGLLFCCIISCNKKDEVTPQIQPQERNVATRMDIPKGYGDSESGNYYQLSFSAGHHADSCKNGCITIWGKTGHIDCMGLGNACVGTLFGVLMETEDLGYAKKKSDDVSEIFSFEVNQTAHSVLENITTSSFEMPARSLRFAPTHEGYNYMNIPEQWIERVDSTQRFLIKNIVLSNTPLY